MPLQYQWGDRVIVREDLGFERRYHMYEDRDTWYYVNKEGVSCVDGVFIEQNETKKSFFDSLPNKSYVHTLINVDKSCG